jgi:hypothetical protein
MSRWANGRAETEMSLRVLFTLFFSVGGTTGMKMFNDIYRKASVRLGSFRFVETSNRGGSVHQQAGSFRFA